MAIKKNWFEKLSDKYNSFGKDKKCNIPDTTNEPDLPDVKKKIDTKPLQEPSRKYYSSPCLLSEIEDDEDVLKR